MTTMTLIAVRINDGAEIRAEWDPESGETMRACLERHGLSKMAWIKDDV